MKHQRLCAWSGVAFVLLFLAGWVLLGGYFPPPSPLASAEEIAALYQNNTNSIRAGLLLAMTSCSFYVPWVAVISEQLSRIRGVSPVLVRTQSLSGTAGMLIFLLPVMIWMAAAFRPDRDPQLTLLLNDLGWIMFTMTFAPFVAQLAVIALAILSDASAQPVFPRWAAYLNLWLAASIMPAGLIVFFKRGPFAWSGFFGIWLPLIVFTLWVVLMLYLLLQAIGHQEREAGAAGSV